jgi:hypothetical protein
MPLVRFFLSGDYRDDINEHNPLGKGGEVAEAFGVLIGWLWHGGVASVAPRAFRKTLGKYEAELCQGYEQHDSHELMAKLLDMLHEDINRVKTKPYIEEEEDAGLPDSVMAERAWRAHLCAADMNAASDVCLMRCLRALLVHVLESVARLLDMLHEQINRVMKKPYIEEEQDAGLPDSVMGERTWHSHQYTATITAAAAAGVGGGGGDAAAGGHLVCWVFSAVTCA